MINPVWSTERRRIVLLRSAFSSPGEAGDAGPAHKGVHIDLRACDFAGFFLLRAFEGSKCMSKEKCLPGRRLGQMQGLMDSGAFESLDHGRCHLK